MARNNGSSHHSRSPDTRIFGTATFSSRSGSYRDDDDDGSSLPPIGSPNISHHSGSSAYMRRGASSPSSHSRSHSQFSSHRSDTHDDYYEGDSTVEYEGDSVAQVEQNIQLDDDEEDEDFYSEAGPTTARTRSPAHSVSYVDSRSPSRTQTYTSRGPTRTNSPTRTYDSRSPSRTQTYDDDARTDARTYDDNRTYDDDRTQDDDRTFDDARSHDDAATYEDDARTYADDARTYEDDAATYDDARTYEDNRSEAHTYDEEGASVYDDGRSGYDDGRSAAYSNSGGRSEGYSGTRSEGYSGARSEGYSGTRSEVYSNSGGRSERNSGTRSGEYDDGRSAGYDDAQSAGYDDAQSGGYDDARTYDEGSEAGSRVSEGQTHRSNTHTGYPQSESQTYARSETQAYAQSYARSDGQEDVRTQYSVEDDAISGTDGTSSVSPEEILASLHQMTLDPVNFERKVLSTVEEQTERSSSQLSRTSSTRHGNGSDISRGTRRSGSHTRASTDAGSLFSPSTHGSYLSPSGPGATQPLSLFSPLLQPPKATETPTAGLKEKEVAEALARHPGASVGRRAGELIAFFESGASGGSRPVSPTKSDASFVSAASVAGAAAVPAGPRTSSGSSSYGQMMSPGKLSTSLSTFTRTFTNTGTGSGSGGGSYTGSGSDLGSTISSPFARSRGTGVGLGFDALFSPSFPTARAGSPFRPTSPAKSVASGASGSYVSGTHKNDEASETAHSETARSGTYQSETNRSDTHQSGTNRSETDRSDTYRSGASDTYPTNSSETHRTHGSGTYRTGTGASETVTVRSAGSLRSRSVASDTYRSGTGTYTGPGSDTYRGGSGSEAYRTGGSGSGRSRSVASENYNSDTYMTGTGSDTYRAGGSDAGVSGFLSSMYPRGSDSGTQTVTGSRAGSQGRSEGGFSQGRSGSGFSQERTEAVTQGRLESGFSQGLSTYGRRSATYQPSEAYTQDTATYIQGSATYTQGSGTYVPAGPSTYIEDSDTYTQGSDTYTQGSRTESPAPPPVPPKSPTTPRASRVQRVDTPAMPTTPKTPNQHHEDKFADWQDRTPQADTPYTANIPLTPKTIGSMTPRTQAGAMTPRTPGGRFGKALSEASTAPTSAEGLMRQRMSREIVNSAPVPSESEAIGLGHNGQDVSVPALWSLALSYGPGHFQPVRISALWYLNVHAPPPFEWLRTQAVLYPNVLILTWIAPAGGRGVVTLDLVNCTEVRSAPSPSHPSARDDVGSVAARLQSIELAETLCPFQLLYADGVERLGTDTARERVRWVGAIWEVLATISRAPTRAVTERSASPTVSLQRSSSVRSSSSEGSASTQFVPPFETIPDMASTLSRQSSFAMPRHTADDMSVGTLIPPARAPSLRRTASMADMELEADIDRALNRSSAGGVPVTVTSGASQGRSTLMSPPPGRRRSGAYTESEGSGLYTPSATDRPRSSFYSASNLTGRDNETYVPTDTEESTVRGVRIAADTLSLRGTSSASMLGDSHDAFSTGYGSGRSESHVSTAAYSRRRTLSAVSPSSGLTRSGGLRRPKRDRTQSLSPAAPDRDRRASISPVDGYSTASERLSVPRSGSSILQVSCTVSRV
ncbi:hypothetical protein FRC10_012267 [Ceratobasidium sp. 414]|nr:hypothetical protein FRC10_012267 [Ceratobasidium sp. 414]